MPVLACTVLFEEFAFPRQGWLLVTYVAVATMTQAGQREGIKNGAATERVKGMLRTLRPAAHTMARRCVTAHMHTRTTQAPAHACPPKPGPWQGKEQGLWLSRCSAGAVPAAALWVKVFARGITLRGCRQEHTKEWPQRTEGAIPPELYNLHSWGVRGGAWRLAALAAEFVLRMTDVAGGEASASASAGRPSLDSQTGVTGQGPLF